MSVFSVCIPRIFHNIPNKKIVSTFEILKLGKVKNMDIVWKTGRDGSSFKMAFIHFSEWNMCNSAARNFRDQVEDPSVDAKLVYDDPWYWLVLPNNSTTIINSYKTGSTYSIPTSLNDISEMINERITNLEDELTCVYEELYQREYIPVKYRSECEWNQDIETGSIVDDTYMGNMSPMTIDELNCSSSTSDATNDNTTDADVGELHMPPNYANVCPEDDSLFSYSQDTFEEEEMSFDMDSNYPNKMVIDNSEVALYEHKTWMTANYCGNN